MKKIVVLVFFTILIACGCFIYKKEQRVPTISVVMPVYNRTDLLVRAIDSILNQTYKDFEFVIVDDGSNEETKAILRKYAKKDKRIQLYHNPKNRGIGYSRQRGLDFARGKYVAIMDSDDWSVPDRLEKSLAFMEDHPEIAAMTGNMEDILDETKMPVYQITDAKKYNVVVRPGRFEVDLMFYNAFYNVASFFKRDFVKEKFIQYRTEYGSAEDYDFWSQIAMMGGKMAKISDVLVFRRDHYTNSESYYQEMIDNSLEIKKRMISRFFWPKEDEIKFDYTVPEKCRILKKMIVSNRKIPQMQQSYLEDRYDDMCPYSLDNTYYLNWNGAEGFLVEKSKGEGLYLPTKKIIKIIKKTTDTLELERDIGLIETFKHHEGDVWVYQPDGKEIHLKHKNWQASFVFNKKETAGCRKDVISECARVKRISDDVIWVDWTGPWESEEFKESEKGIYKFVRALKKSETF